jgi:hypothetical protein
MKMSPIATSRTTGKFIGIRLNAQHPKPTIRAASGTIGQETGNTLFGLTKFK